jgi:hypothetical protein
VVRSSAGLPASHRASRAALLSKTRHPDEPPWAKGQNSPNKLWQHLAVLQGGRPRPTSAYLFSGLPLAMARPALRRALPKAAGSPGHEAHRRGPRHPLHPRWGRNRALNTARTRARTRALRSSAGTRSSAAAETEPGIAWPGLRCYVCHSTDASPGIKAAAGCWGQRSRRPPVRAVLVLLFLPNTSRGRPVPRAPPARPPGLTATYATARA